MKAKRNKLTGDLILISALLLLSFAIYLLSGFFTTAGSSVEITVDGEFYAGYSLNDDRVVKIGETNTLVIKSGEVYMTDACCKNQTCVKQGKISKSGESIVCLPNKIIVTILSDSDSTGPDAVSY